MSATLETIRAAIGAHLLAVPDIGVVHPYERYARTEKSMAELFMWQPSGVPAPPRELRGWFVRRTGEGYFADTSTSDEVRIDWQIRGFMALRDDGATELLFDHLVNAVRNRFLSDVTLGGLLDAVVARGEALGPQLVESGPYMFCGVLCHGARLAWTTKFRVTGAPIADPEALRLGEFRTLHANWDVPPFVSPPPALPADAVAEATDHITVRED